MSTIKQFIADFNRNKSANKVNNKSKSPMGRPLSKNGAKNHIAPQTNNFTRTTNITVKKVNLVKAKPLQSKTKKIEFEDDLDSRHTNDLKISSQRSNKGNSMDFSANNRIGHFDKKSTTGHLSRKAPRKSPFQISKEYQPKNFNIRTKITVKNSNNIQRVKPATANSNSPFVSHKPSASSTSMSRTFYSKPKQDRSLSPMFKKKENNKLSPNLAKPKYISKSPILGHSLLNRFKNSSLGSSSSHVHSTNTVNKGKIVAFKRPVQSARRPNNVTNIQTKNNKQQVIISEDFSQDAHNTTSNKGLTTSNAQSSNNNSNINTNTNVKKEEKISSPKVNPVNRAKSPEGTRKISVNKSPVLEKKEQTPKVEMKEEERPLQMPPKEIEQKKIEKPVLISKTEPPKKVIKKIRNVYEFTHVGFDGEADKENNQDSYFIFNNFAGHSDYSYMSVCDGHGVEGHEVSRYIKKILPEDMSTNLKNYDILKKDNKKKVHEIIQDTFNKANDKLVENENINSIFSGSTCVSVIYTPERLICPNIGDSRAVLGRCVNGNWESLELTRDHKPTESDERKRIIGGGGRIQPFIEDGEEIGPQRVWLEEDDVPGLAMTRSFGDRVAATVGVISIPEIKEFDFKEEDKFMIIASDGVWEFIPSSECVKIVSEFYLRNEMEKCCQFLYEESKKRWLKEEEVIDDITMIIVIFE